MVHPERVVPAPQEGPPDNSLVRWLVEAALPRWHAAGLDADGGAVEALGLDGQVLALARRARVAPRQLHVFCRGPELGWPAPAAEGVLRSVDYIETRFRRADGFYRSRITAEGAVLDDAALLYDQAFVLLGLAAATRAVGAGAGLEERAVALRERLARHWQRGAGEFQSGDGVAPGAGERREANPHMHLLEACLAWAEISSDATWRRWADEIVQLALTRFRDGALGVIYETYDARWQRLDDRHAHAVEPGHQYEWAWLLMRAQADGGGDGHAAARRLIDLAEAHGVHDGVAVNGLDARLRVRDPNARLWVQTERLRACTAALRRTHEPRYQRAADQAAAAILPYLATPLRGLWYDERTAAGRHHASVVHASTLYHLVSAALELA